MPTCARRAGLFGSAAPAAGAMYAGTPRISRRNRSVCDTRRNSDATEVRLRLYRWRVGHTQRRELGQHPRCSDLPSEGRRSDRRSAEAAFDAEQPKHADRAVFVPIAERCFLNQNASGSGPTLSFIERTSGGDGILALHPQGPTQKSTSPMRQAQGWEVCPLTKSRPTRYARARSLCRRSANRAPSFRLKRWTQEATPSSSARIPVRR